MAGAWGLKMCLPLLSIIQAKTPEQIYNSTTGRLIQFIGADVFFFFSSLPPPPFIYLFIFGFLPPQCWTMLHLLFNFTAKDCLDTQFLHFLEPKSGIDCSTNTPHFNYLTGLRKEVCVFCGWGWGVKDTWWKTAHLFIQLSSICPVLALFPLI